MTQTIRVREASLEHANAIRLARAEMKREISRGELLIVEAFDLDCARSMTVFQLVVAHKRWGSSTATGLLTKLRINPNRRVGQLTARQKTALAAALPGERGAA